MPSSRSSQAHSILTVICVSILRTLALIAVTNISDQSMTHLSYMIAHDGGCLLCVATLTGFEDGLMLALVLGKALRLDLHRKEM